MRRWTLASLIGLSLMTLAVPTGVTGEKADAPITIEYHGNSFYIITSSKGKRIAFDPHLIPDYGRPEIPPKADIVTISHNHNDHNRVDAFGNADTIRVLRGLKTMSLKSDWNIFEETIGDIKVRTVGLYHDDSEGLQRGKVAAFIVDVDGWKIAHLGDLGHLLTPAQLKRIGPVDVLMIPVGGIYTLNGSEARKVVEQIKPKEYIFPMHYGTKVFDATLPPDEFYEDIEKRKLAIHDENVLKLNRDAQRPRPLTVQLHYWPKEEKKKDEKKK